MMSIVKRRSCIVFAVILVFMCFAVPLNAGAIAGVDDAAAVVAACLAAWGIGMTVAGTAQTIEQFINSEMQSFSSSIGTSVATWISTWNIGMTAQGTLVANAAATYAIAQFADWLVSKYQLTSNGSAVDAFGQALSFNVVPVIPYVAVVNRLDGTYILCQDTTRGYGVGVYYNDNDLGREFPSTVPLYTFAVNRGNDYLLYFASNIDWRSGTIYSAHVRRFAPSTGNSSAQIGYGNGGIIADSFSNLYYWESYDVEFIPDVWRIPLVDSLLDGLNNIVLGGEESVTLRPGTIDVPTSAEVEGKAISLDLDIPAGTTLTDAIPQIYTEVLTGTIEATSTLTDAATMPEVIPDVGAAGDYEVPGLAQVFPFCIPFDLYEAFAVLAAEPVAPSFDIPFVIPGLVNYTFEIDLSEFDTAATILRTMELLLFIVGLILITRRLIRG